MGKYPKNSIFRKMNKKISKDINDDIFEKFMDHIKLTQWERENMTPKWRKEWESTVLFQIFKMIESWNEFIISILKNLEKYIQAVEKKFK